MRKLLVYLFTFSILSLSIYSQNQISIPNLKKDTGEIVIPIETSNLGEIGSFTIKLDYDSSVLEFAGFKNNPFEMSSNFLYSQNNGKLNFVWFSVNPVLITEKLFEIKFQYLGGETPISFVGTNEITDGLANPLQVQFVDGSIAPIISDITGEDMRYEFSLYQNYPNPFNPTTNFSYSIPFASGVVFSIYDISGRKIKILLDSYKEAGSYSLKWDSEDQPSGIYFYTLEVEGQQKYKETKKMLLLK